VSIKSIKVLLVVVTLVGKLALLEVGKLALLEAHHGEEWRFSLVHATGVGVLNLDLHYERAYINLR
jgi:hypothetical protein